VRGLPGARRAIAVAGAAARPHRLRRLALPVFLRVRGQSAVGLARKAARRRPARLDRAGAAARAARGGHGLRRRARTPWLAGFSLYMALREAHGHIAWHDWPEPLRRREPAALAEARKSLALEIRAHEA